MDMQFKSGRSAILMQWLCRLHDFGFDGVIGGIGYPGTSVIMLIGGGVLKCSLDIQVSKMREPRAAVLDNGLEL